MRAALAGFFFGALALLLALLIAQQVEVRPVINQVAYHFDACVFSGTSFPHGDLDNGQLLRRALVPALVTTRFFDASFDEVRHADHPGRYGAVVRIRFTGELTSYRFITLYRTPQAIRGDEIAIPITAQLPPALGIDPAVAAAQPGLINGVLQNLLIDYENGRAPESFAILLAALSEISPGAAPEYLHADLESRNEAWWDKLKTQLKLQEQYPILVDLPHGYAANSTRHWPLVLFLHHADAGGHDRSVLRNCALMGLIQNGRKVPAIVVAPQLPTGEVWSIPVLDRLLDTMQRQYRVDPDRIYLTGVSAGGDITWDFAMLHPGRFAAIVPMSGESDPRDAPRLRTVPVWGFQGGKDPIVPAPHMQAMVDAVRQAGGHAHLTINPNAGHDCWNKAYATDALWTWLFAQKRGQPEVLTPGTPIP